MADTFPFVCVIWNDAWANGTDSLGENEVDTNHKPTVMETRGWMLGDTAVGVSLFNERCLDVGDGTYRSRTFIPRAMIRSITELKEAKPRKLKPKVSVPPKYVEPDKSPETTKEPN